MVRYPTAQSTRSKAFRYSLLSSTIPINGGRVIRQERHFGSYWMTT